jgi:hypothetical protein
MHRFKRLSRGVRVTVGLVVAGAAFAVASSVYADIPDSGVIHACYSKTTHGLFVIDTDLGQHCNAATENALNWSSTGSGGTGTTGATGATGATGPTGPTGPTSSGLPGYAWFYVTNIQLIPPGESISFAGASAGPQAGNVVHIDGVSPTQLVFDSGGTYAVTFSVVTPGPDPLFGLSLNGATVPGSIISDNGSAQTTEGRVLITVNVADVLQITNPAAATTEAIASPVAGAPSASIVIEKIG